MIKMMQGNYNAGLIGGSTQHNPFDKPSKIARLSGPMMEYKFENTAPKKKIKRIKKSFVTRKKKIFVS